MTELLLDREAFTGAVAFAAKALPRNALHPALTGLRVISNGDGEAAVSAFDYDTYATARLDAQGVAFDVLLPGHALLRYLGGMTGDHVSVVPGDREVALTCGASRVILPRLNLADYPSPPDAPPTLGTVDAEAFIGALADVRPSIDPNTTRHRQKGYALLLGSPLVVAGIHQQRFCVREVEWTGTGDTHAVVPVSAFEGIQAMTGQVAIGCDDGRISVSDGPRHIVARLIDEPPDDFMRMLDLPGVTLRLTLNREATISALRFLVLGDTRKQAAHGAMVMDIGTDAADLALTGADLDASTRIDAKVDGEPAVVGWTAENLLHGLTATDAEVVTLSIQTPTRAALLTADDDPAFRYLVMPRRLA